jgi:hypothetical protein
LGCAHGSGVKRLYIFSREKARGASRNVLDTTLLLPLRKPQTVEKVRKSSFESKFFCTFKLDPHLRIGYNWTEHASLDDVGRLRRDLLSGSSPVYIGLPFAPT